MEPNLTIHLPSIELRAGESRSLELPLVTEEGKLRATVVSETDRFVSADFSVTLTGLPPNSAFNAPG